MAHIVERLYRRVTHKYLARDLLLAAQMQARDEALAYWRQAMGGAIFFKDRLDLLRHGLGLALAEAGEDALIMEFGVAGGVSLRALAGATNRIVHGFDSFTGLPEAWAGTTERAGAFSQGGKLPKVPETALLHPGLFADTLPRFLQVYPGPAAFIHIDCDLYSATVDILTALEPRLRPGTIIVFDEYFNYPGWHWGEFKAFREFLGRTGWRYAYRALSARGGQVMIELLDPAGDPA